MPFPLTIQPHKKTVDIFSRVHEHFQFALTIKSVSQSQTGSFWKNAKEDAYLIR